MKKNWEKCPRFNAVIFDVHYTGLTAEKLEEMRCDEIESRTLHYRRENERRRRREDALQGYY